MQDLEAKLAAAEARLARLPKPSSLGGPLDHGYLNIPLSSRPSIDRDIDRGVAIALAEDDVKSLRSRITYARVNAPVPFTTEELKAARAIRTSSGWHKVAKVNTKSVSVETGYSWTDRYTIDKILEVRA